MKACTQYSLDTSCDSVRWEETATLRVQVGSSTARSVPRFEQKSFCSKYKLKPESPSVLKAYQLTTAQAISSKTWKELLH